MRHYKEPGRETTFSTRFPRTTVCKETRDKIPEVLEGDLLDEELDNTQKAHMDDEQKAAGGDARILQQAHPAKILHVIDGESEIQAYDPGAEEQDVPVKTGATCCRCNPVGGQAGVTWPVWSGRKYTQMLTEAPRRSQ
jgi:hypothetical protein